MGDDSPLICHTEWCLSQPFDLLFVFCLSYWDSSNRNHTRLEPRSHLLLLMIYVWAVLGGSLWSAFIRCDLPLYQMSYLKLLLPSNSFKHPLRTPDHILGFRKCCPHPQQPSPSQARVWLLLVVLAMDAWRSLLKPNMVLNQIYKCLGVLWKTHIQAALTKPVSVYVCVCLRPRG